MSEGKLKTACLGLGRQATELLDLAIASGLYEIVSVADGSLTNAQKAAQKYNCAAFDDYRQFILQSDFDILVVTEPLYKCIKYVKEAISKRSHILKLIPTAANFEQSSALINLADKNGVKYITALPAKFAAGFERLSDYLKTINRNQFYFISLCASFGADFLQLIKSYDPSTRALSGGGVLLNECFELISITVENFSLPQQIYTLTTNQSRDKKTKEYLGEDTVIATLDFGKGFVGTLQASVQIGSAVHPPIKIYGDEVNIIATANRLTVYDRDNRLILENKFSLKPEKCITEMFIDIGRALLEPDKYKLRSKARLDLATMAFIEAAYLSSKTGMPESPRKFFEISEKEKYPFG